MNRACANNVDEEINIEGKIVIYLIKLGTTDTGLEDTSTIGFPSIKESSKPWLYILTF